jgi:excinuclease ABC subunit A
VAEGTPEEVAATPGSYTGAVLGPVLGVLPLISGGTRSRTTRKRAATGGRAAASNGAGTTRAGAKQTPSKKRVAAGR